MLTHVVARPRRLAPAHRNDACLRGREEVVEIGDLLCCVRYGYAKGGEVTYQCARERHVGGDCRRVDEGMKMIKIRGDDTI